MALARRQALTIEERGRHVLEETRRDQESGLASGGMWAEGSGECRTLPVLPVDGKRMTDE